jgi:aminopeptidase-like protein
LTRTPLDRLPQYHIWADNLEPMQPASLADSRSKCGGIAKILGHNCCYLNLNPHRKPQLGRRRLYSHLGGQYAGQLDQAALWVLSLSDGMHSLLDEAEQSGPQFNLIHRVAETLLRCELLAPIKEGESP